MARFHLTSDLNSHEEAQQLCADAKLDLYESIEDSPIFMSTYKKRLVDNQNYYATNEGNFIASTGTFIIDGEIGKSALQKAYKVFERSGLNEVREAAFGHYSLIVKDGHTVTVCTDPNSVYQLYYTSDDDWFVSNSLQLCGEFLDNRQINRHGLYRRIIESTEMHSSTLYTDVNRLLGTEKLVLDIDSEELQTEPLSRPATDWSYEDASFRDVLNEYTDQVERIFSEISEAVDNIGVQATGGLDSRSVLAGVLAQNKEPVVLYGVGNSKITNTKDKDLKISKQYSERYEIPFYQMDWSGEYPIRIEEWDRLFEKYGLRYHMYGGTPNFFKEFESEFPTEPELIMDGYGYGVFSNTYYWENDSDMPIKFEDVVTEVLTDVKGFTTEAFKCKNEYMEELIEMCKDRITELDDSIDPEKSLDLTTFTRTIQLLNGRSQSKYPNLMNEFRYHLSPYSTFRLGRRLIDVPPAYREGEKLRIKLLKNLEPGMLDIPIYSGTRKRKFTKNDKIVLEPDERIVSWFGRHLPSFALEVIRPIYRDFKGSSQTSTENEIMKENVKRLLEDGPVSQCINLEKYDNHVRRHTRFPQFERGVRMIGFDSISD